MKLSLHQELQERGFLYQYSDQAVFELFEQGGQSFYWGVDPTADSMHLGNFVGIMHAVNYMKRGNKLYLIVGGATGMIGDPGGKDSERTFLDEETLQHNVQSISHQLQDIIENLTDLSGESFQCEVVNNLDFYRDMNVIEYLRKVGKYITVNAMMNKETVKKRIEDPDKSISYTEFSYMLIQGYDFVELYQRYGVRLQVCGSDQWGNSVTGLEMIRKHHTEGDQAYVVSCPLLTDASGKKFGKSEGNALWLDPDKTSPYFIYQYFMNTDDEDVEKFLKILTLLDIPTIQEIVTKHAQDPAQRYGQERLAHYVVTTVFGAQAAAQAAMITRFLFDTDADKLELLQHFSAQDIQALTTELPSVSVSKQSEQQDYADAFVNTTLVSSRKEAKKLAKQGALYINEAAIEVDDLTNEINKGDFHNGVVMLRKGKKKYALIKKI